MCWSSPRAAMSILPPSLPGLSAIGMRSTGRFRNPPWGKSVDSMNPVVFLSAQGGRSRRSFETPQGYRSRDQAFGPRPSIPARTRIEEQ